MKKSKISAYKLTICGKFLSLTHSSLNKSNDQHSTFLPQDRVAEFARMTPQELLRATESAAGDRRLTQWHDQLTQAGDELRSVISVSVTILI